MEQAQSLLYLPDAPLRLFLAHFSSLIERNLVFSMKVILTKDHHELGINGSVVDVSEGYARNFLIPHNLAVRATDNVIAHYEDRKKARAKKEAARKEQAREMAGKFEALSLNAAVRVGEEGRLYGTVTTKEIVQLLEEQHQITVDKKQVEISQPIKQLGEHEVKVRLHPEVSAKLKVNVQAEA